MGKFYESIPEHLLRWIPKQEMFWVATAPLMPDGHVNVSPKGLSGTFHINNSNQVWYEDMTGSGSETIAHLRENGRITILFHAFQGPPMIARLFGVGKVYEFGTPEYDRYVPSTTRTAGSRAVIVVDVHKVGTSCGYGVPFYDFRGHRTLLPKFAASKEQTDIEHDSTDTADARFESFSEKGLRAYWKDHSHSIDGLPSLLACFLSPKKFSHVSLAQDPLSSFWSEMKESNEDGGGRKSGKVNKSFGHDITVFIAGLASGIAIAGLVVRAMKVPNV